MASWQRAQERTSEPASATRTPYNHRVVVVNVVNARASLLTVSRPAHTADSSYVWLCEELLRMPGDLRPGMRGPLHLRLRASGVEASVD